MQPATQPTGQPTPAAPGVDEPFVNEPIDVSGLPQLPEERYEPLDPTFLRIRWTGDAVAAAVVIVVASVITAVLPESASLPRWVPALVALVFLALIGVIAWLQRLEISRLGYLVRDQDFSYRSGVIGRSVVTVPFARIQHVSIDRGPLERAFGLATLQMRTAGSGGLTVPGMTNETAQRLKALVADRAAAVADDELADLANGDEAFESPPAPTPRPAPGADAPPPGAVPPPIPPAPSSIAAAPPPPAPVPPPSAPPAAVPPPSAPPAAVPPAGAPPPGAPPPAPGESIEDGPEPPR